MRVNNGEEEVSSWGMIAVKVVPVVVAMVLLLGGNGACSHSGGTNKVIWQQEDRCLLYL